MPEVKMTPAKRPMPTRRPMVSTTLSSAQSNGGVTLPELGTTAMPPSRPARKPNVLRATIIIVILIILAGAAGYLVSKPSVLASFRGQQGFYAVFLTTGQAYFGTIVSENDRNLVMDNVFYLQLVDEVVPAAEEGGTPQTIQRQQLTRKGEEPYAPENRIRINREQVAVIEKLSESSPLLQEIRQRIGQ